LASRVYKGTGKGDHGAVESCEEGAPWPAIDFCVRADSEKILAEVEVTNELVQVGLTVEVAFIVFITREPRVRELRVAAEAGIAEAGGVVLKILGKWPWHGTTVISVMLLCHTTTYGGLFRPHPSLFMLEVFAGTEDEREYRDVALGSRPMFRTALVFGIVHLH
jgi:hypothetical protein